MQTDAAGLADPSRPGTPETLEAPETEHGASDGGAGKLARGIARGALIVAVLTGLSRVLGLLRTVVFAQTVGAGCLGTAYVTANQVPNLIVELAIGGALTSAMVPVLARSASRAATDPQAKAHVAQVSSALMTWSVLILLPVTVAVTAAAAPIAGLLNPVNPNADCAHGDVLNETTFMLVSFAPQILLYGISVVLFGLLQAFRKFGATSLAPVLGNVVTITAYLVFASLDHHATLATTPLAANLVLSVGTTMNIGMLIIVTLPATWRLGLRWRPTLRFPPGVVGRASGLALVGLLEFVAADIYGVITIDLANGHGTTGALVLFNYGNLVFTAVCSVLPLAIVTSAFPVLSATDGDQFDRTSAGSTRAVMLMSMLSTAIMISVTLPAAHVLTQRQDQVAPLALAFLFYAPGVAGLGHRRQPVAGAVRARQAQGGGRSPGGAATGARGAHLPHGPARAAAPDRGGARARKQHRATPGGHPDGHRHAAAARAGRRRRARSRDARRHRGGRRRGRGGPRGHAGLADRRECP